MSWTEEKIQIVRDNLTKLDAADIGKLIGKSARAVKLYAHRNRWVYKPTVKVNLVIELLTLAVRRPEYFRPTKVFFAETGITQMRFWRLYRGEANPTHDEYCAIRDHLGVNPERVLENRQLKLFENEGGVKSARKNRKAI